MEGPNFGPCCDEFRIMHEKSSLYNPKSNGLAKKAVQNRRLLVKAIYMSETKSSPGNGLRHCLFVCLFVFCVFMLFGVVFWHWFC